MLKKYRFKSNVIKSFPIIYTILYDLYLFLLRMLEKDVFNRSMKIVNRGGGRIVKSIKGNNNQMYIGNGSMLRGTVIRVRGNNNIIKFGDNVYVGPNCSFWMEGNNIQIEIGDNTTFTGKVHFCAQEDESKIHVGKDCMFSNSIIVRTSDSHPIYDLKTNKRLNYSASVSIGDHVWIAPNSVIMKKSRIRDGVIVGSHTLINKEIPANSLVVGMPAKIVKENIYWTREKLF